MKLANRSIRRSKQKANRGILKLLVDGDQKGIKTKLLKFLKEKKKKKEKNMAKLPLHINFEPISL